MRSTASQFEQDSPSMSPTKPKGRGSWTSQEAALYVMETSRNKEEVLCALNSLSELPSASFPSPSRLANAMIRLGDQTKEIERIGSNLLRNWFETSSRADDASVCEDLERVVGMLRSSEKQRVLAALAVLRLWTVTKESEHMLDRVGAVAEVLCQLRGDSVDESIRESGLQFLCSLSLTEDAQRKELIQPDDIRKHWDRMVPLSLDSDIVRLTLILLSRISSYCFPAQNQIREMGGLDRALVCLGSALCSTVEASCVLLHRLAFQNDLNQSEIGQNGGFPKILKATEREDADEGLAVAALDALASICTRHTKNQVRFGEEDGIRIVLNIAKKFASSRDVGLAACGVFRVACHIDDNRAKLTELGGIDFITSTLKSELEWNGAVELPVLALSNATFSNNEGQMIAGRRGAVALCLELVRKNPENPKTQEQACRLIRNITDDNPTNRGLFHDKGGTLAIIDIVTRFEEQPRVLEQAISVLLSLSASSGIADSMRVEEALLRGVEMAVSRYGQDYPVIKKNGRRLLENVDTSLLSIDADSRSFKDGVRGSRSRGPSSVSSWESRSFKAERPSFHARSGGLPQSGRSLTVHLSRRGAALLSMDGPDVSRRSIDAPTSIEESQAKRRARRSAFFLRRNRKREAHHSRG